MAWKRRTGSIYGSQAAGCSIILNALRHRPHFAHYSVEQALDVIAGLKPRQAYLTHFCHEIGLYATEDARLPEGVHLGYDGLRISVL